MTHHDSLGNQITTDSDEAAARIDDFVMGFLGYQARAERIFEAAEADPDCALAHGYAALAWMFLESPEAPEKARASLDRAQALRDRTFAREALIIDLAAAWIGGNIPAVLNIAEALLDEHPRDLVALKLHQYHSFNRGDAPAMLRLAHKVFEANRDSAHMFGMRAFAHEQCHLIDAAERDAQAALELDPAEPWAHHALAHVHLTRGTIAEGRAFLESVRPSWQGLNSFMHTHNHWHLGLLMLSEGDEEALMDLYDSDIWGIAKDYSQDQAGAVALLARAEMAGFRLGDRWEDLADHLEARAQDTTLPFLTLHYLYGLARANRPAADSLMNAIAARARQAPGFERTAWAEVAHPAAIGLLAHARGDHETAAVELGRALPRMMDVGGSHAQRDLFHLIHLDALIGSGRLIAAQQILEQRRSFDPDGVPLNRDLARVYESLGLPLEAAQARGRIAR